MNKNESKYYNTALLLILEKKEYEFISIKEVCEKAGVNRSTFYLHYETMDDLLNEAIEMVNDNSFSVFNINSKSLITKSLENKDKKELIFIKGTILKPYLNYILENQKLFLLSYKKYKFFKGDEKFNKLSKELFLPITKVFKIKEERQEYCIKYFRDGIMSIIYGCKESIDTIIEIIYDCTDIQKHLDEINSKDQTKS